MRYDFTTISLIPLPYEQNLPVNVDIARDALATEHTRDARRCTPKLPILIADKRPCLELQPQLRPTYRLLKC